MLYEYERSAQDVCLFTLPYEIKWHFIPSEWTGNAWNTTNPARQVHRRRIINNVLKKCIFMTCSTCPTGRCLDQSQTGARRRTVFIGCECAAGLRRLSARAHSEPDGLFVIRRTLEWRGDGVVWECARDESTESISVKLTAADYHTATAYLIRIIVNSMSWWNTRWKCRFRSLSSLVSIFALIYAPCMKF